MSTPPEPRPPRPRTKRPPPTPEPLIALPELPKLDPPTVIFWQRWPLLASALGNVLIFLFNALGVRFTYASTAPPSPNPPPHIITWLVLAFFWGGLGVATISGVCVVLGVLRTRYHLLLHLTLFCTMLPMTLILLAEILLSFRLSAGDSEPIFLCLLLLYQTAVLLSAHSVEPSSLVYRVHLPRFTRWRQAVHAFRQAIGEPPSRDGAP